MLVLPSAKPLIGCIYIYIHTYIYIYIYTHTYVIEKHGIQTILCTGLAANYGHTPSVDPNLGQAVKSPLFLDIEYYLERPVGRPSVVSLIRLNTIATPRIM